MGAISNYMVGMGIEAYKTCYSAPKHRLPGFPDLAVLFSRRTLAPLCSKSSC